MAQEEADSAPAEEYEEVVEEEGDEVDEATARKIAAKIEGRRLYLERRMAPPTSPHISEMVHNKMGGYEFFEKVLKSPKHVTAPMVDQSFLPFRMMTRKHGSNMCYTPMFHSKTFSHDPTYRKKFFTTVPEDRPLVVQFCGNEPLFLLKAARYVEGQCDAVDINLGCPQNIARKGNYGSFLMDSPEVVYEMVSILHKYLKIPVFCKMRVFTSEEKTIEFAKMLESAGCQMLTVHGRTREQKGHEQGMANMDIISKIKAAVSIPVIANGNINEFEDVEPNLKASNADGVMSAETILKNPALFSGKIYHPCDLCQEFMDFCEKYPMEFRFVRTHLLNMLKESLDYNADLRIAINRAREIRQARAIIEELRSREQGGVLGTCNPDVILREKRAATKAKKAAEEIRDAKVVIESFSIFAEQET